jgi:hypothetical protein
MLGVSKTVGSSRRRQTLSSRFVVTFYEMRGRGWKRSRSSNGSPEEANARVVNGRPTRAVAATCGIPSRAPGPRGAGRFAASQWLASSRCRPSPGRAQAHERSPRALNVKWIGRR